MGGGSMMKQTSSWYLFSYDGEAQSTTSPVDIGLNITNSSSVEHNCSRQLWCCSSRKISVGQNSEIRSLRFSASMKLANCPKIPTYLWLKRHQHSKVATVLIQSDCRVQNFFPCHMAHIENDLFTQSHFSEAIRRHYWFKGKQYNDTGLFNFMMSHRFRD